MKSQLSKIKSHLLSGKSITALQALQQYGCFRLSARIDDLKNSGMLIDTITINDNGKRYARYVAHNNSKA